MIPARLTVVTLGARDLPSLRAFYEAMGWRSRPGSTMSSQPLSSAASSLPCIRGNSSGQKLLPTWWLRDGAFSGITLAMNVEARDQVDVVYDAAVAAGAQPVAPPQDRESGWAVGLCF